MVFWPGLDWCFTHVYLSSEAKYTIRVVYKPHSITYPLLYYISQCFSLSLLPINSSIYDACRVPSAVAWTLYGACSLSLHLVIQTQISIAELPIEVTRLSPPPPCRSKVPRSRCFNRDFKTPRVPIIKTSFSIFQTFVPSLLSLHYNFLSSLIIKMSTKDMPIPFSVTFAAGE